jgi:hypothetical protein
MSGGDDGAKVLAVSRPAGEAALAGFVLGLADLASVFGIPAINAGYILAAFALGLRHAGRGAWSAWVPLRASLYVVHAVAYLCGARQPYVEASLEGTLFCLWLMFPVGIGIGLGALIRRGLAAIGMFHRNFGAPVRLLPGTVRGWLIAIALIGVAIAALRWIAVDSGTVYAPGYNEGRFAAIRKRMTAEEVEALMGPPLSRSAWTANDPGQMWMYSRGATDTSDYTRRWVYLRDGRVEEVIRDYWYD